MSDKDRSNAIAIIFGAIGAVVSLWMTGELRVGEGIVTVIGFTIGIVLATLFDHWRTSRRKMEADSHMTPANRSPLKHI